MQTGWMRLAILSAMPGLCSQSGCAVVLRFSLYHCTAVDCLAICREGPNVQLFGGIFNLYEPMYIQAFDAKPAIEGFDVCVAGALSGL